MSVELTGRSPVSYNRSLANPASAGKRASESLPNKCNSNTNPSRLRIAPHSHRPQRYLLQICEGDRQWSYPIAWTRGEVVALKMMALNSIETLNLSLTPKGPPVDVGKLHQLIEQLFPSVCRVAAMAQEVAA